MTPFQITIYNIVKKIPKGQTMTYKQVAMLAGRPKAFRAVGNILNKNYNPTIPCHRVVRSDGKIGGYNRGSASKEELLRGEKNFLEMERLRNKSAQGGPASGEEREK